MLVRAPPGYEFDPDCLKGLAVRPMAVFRDLVPWPEEYAQWPTLATLTKCRGDKNRAVISIVPTEDSFLLGKTLYILRVSVRNAPATPQNNFWGLEYNGETARKTDMPGFTYAGPAVPAE